MAMLKWLIKLSYLCRST